MSQVELFSNIATLIFDEVNRDPCITERRKTLEFAKEQNVNISEAARTKIKAELQAIASSPEQGGIYSAVKLLTPLTDEEEQLAIDWIGQGKIKPSEIKGVFPNLYHYLAPLEVGSLGADEKWVCRYFDLYRQSKIANFISPELKEILVDKNGNQASFQAWKDEFKTVRTILYNRKDIDVIYWIDGLGVDWIPFIRHIVAGYAKEHVYLNEVYIAAAELPTTTSVNKEKLKSLLPEGTELPKTGDLDSFAHKSKTFPQYIIEEMQIVEEAVRKILDNYNGKKIAFVSDHGITYLGQLENGLKMAGVKADHEGRVAITTGAVTYDPNYMVLNDGRTLVSLSHHSLTDKVDKGHGAHGGATPEEVLVPILIISSQKNSSNYSVTLVSDEIDGTEPVIKVSIKGLSSIDVPSLEYNGMTYQLSKTDNDTYASERLNLVDTATKVIIRVNDKPFKTFSIKVSTGASEADDLFDF